MAVWWAIAYDINGAVEVEATVLSTGVVEKRIFRNLSGLSEAELQARFAALEAIKLHPRDQSENRLLIARAERIYAEQRGEARYLTATLGLLGWMGLILAFAPWRSPTIAQALPWIALEPGSDLTFFIEISPAYLGAWLMFGSQVWTKGSRRLGADTAMSKAAEIRWDSAAFVFFPFWAFGRGLYVRGLIGTLAWIAVFSQAVSLPGGDVGDPGFIGAMGLMVMLHLTAGSCGKRWVMYKLLRTIAAADRAGFSDRAERWLYIRQRGTKDPRILRKVRKALAMLAVWLLTTLILIALVYFAPQLIGARAGYLINLIPH